MQREVCTNCISKSLLCTAPCYKGGTVTKWVTDFGISGGWCNQYATTSDFCKCAEPACARNNPAISIAPTSACGDGGGTVNYTLSVTNADISACGASSFAISYSLPAGFSATLAPPSPVPISAGASASIVFSLKSPANASGSNAFMVVATNGNSAESANSTGTFIVTGINSFSCTPIGLMRASCAINAPCLVGGKNYFALVGGSGKADGNAWALGATAFAGVSPVSVIVFSLAEDDYSLGAWVFEGATPDITAQSLMFWKNAPVAVQLRK